MSAGAALLPMLTAEQVAEVLAVPQHRVYELTRRGVLPHTRIGRQVRYDAERLREWIDSGGTEDTGDDS